MYIAKRISIRAPATNGACFMDSEATSIPHDVKKEPELDSDDDPLHPPEAHNAGHTTNINATATVAHPMRDLLIVIVLSLGFIPTPSSVSHFSIHIAHRPLLIAH
jgi:hypothetical protein